MKRRKHIHIDQAVHDELEVYASSRGLSWAAAAEEIISDFLKAARGESDAAKIIIGYIKLDVFADLSEYDECGNEDCPADLSAGAYIGIRGDGTISAAGVCASCAGL